MNTITAVIAVAIFSITSVSFGQVYLPQNQREENYGDGSCMFASAIAQLNHVDAKELARYVRNNYYGGESFYHINKTFRQWGIKTEVTYKGNRLLLDYCHNNRLTALISYHRGHACTFMGWYVPPGLRIPTHAYVLNPNNPGEYETPTYARFMRNWLGNDGCAVVVIPQ